MSKIYQVVLVNIEIRKDEMMTKKLKIRIPWSFNYDPDKEVDHSEAALSRDVSVVR